MTRIMLAFLCLLAATSAQAAERRFTVSGFEKVQVEGPFQVTLATGKGSNAVATGSQQALDRISIQVEGRTLRIRPNRSAWGSPPKPGEGGVAIALSTHELTAVTLAGSGSLTVDRARAMRFDAAVSGSGRIAIGSVEADKLNLQLLGAGSISVGGKAKSLRATVTGQGALDAAGLAADDAEIAADTTGNIALAVRRAAKIASSGAGDVTVGGTPACTVSGIGSGRVRCGK
ncbi:MAG TPA: DUF2807 domain-containing protein [Allosphingosinicella sp.]|jgi:hypothetical protein|uniref:GIN domain-containing protein n=1 Tax=Allosphingosinicella sp. TaxID=2823234 RepID=UPI002F27D21F